MLDKKTLVRIYCFDFGCEDSDNRRHIAANDNAQLGSKIQKTLNLNNRGLALASYAAATRSC
jgi:hypothetical protein